MKRAKREEESGPSWMDTYGDMVTLLLCFFVLLYSISSVDQVKWDNLVRSFDPDAEVISIVEAEHVDNAPNPATGQTTEIDAQFEEMYADLQELQNESIEMVDIEIAQGDNYQFIRFNDTVFFDGDSAVLKEEGKVVLDSFAEIVVSGSESIAELHVLGHTTQAHPDIPSEVMNDRVLSATRSAVVVAYLQEKVSLNPEQMVSLGYGQYRPIASFETEEERAKNRRVEILITKTGSIDMTFDQYYEEVYDNIDS